MVKANSPVVIPSSNNCISSVALPYLYSNCVLINRVLPVQNISLNFLLAVGLIVISVDLKVGVNWVKAF